MTKVKQTTQSPKTGSMVTILDNNQRVFLVQSQGWRSRDLFCNLADIPRVLRENFEPNEDFKVFEYWNRKIKTCSKKYLNGLFIANDIDLHIK